MGSSLFCDPGWVYFNHTRKCYQVVLKDMNVYDAINTCKSMNATMASIHGEAHNDFLINLECDDGWARYELTNLHGERYNMCYYVR
uniref:C-type lectin domain-containing protein n=1 Tax=Acrobeloides nanus TaxID=290746 RepID=A0A914CGX6_9BILA